MTNYAQGRVHSNRIARMVRETTNMEFVTTRTEIEALLLEANLIKRSGRASTCCCATTSRFPIFW